MLDGFELAARRLGAQRSSPRALDGYDPVDARHAVPRRRSRVGAALVGAAGSQTWNVAASGRPATPIALFLREHADAWQTLRPAARCRGGSARADARGACWTRCATRGASLLRDLSIRLRPRRRRSCVRHRRARGGRARGVGRLLGAARADLRAARSDRSHARSPRANFAGRWSAIGVPRADPRTPRRPRVETQAWTLLAPLRRRLPPPAGARDERRALARADARLPAARGARRDPRRPVRLGHVGRAVRAAGRGRAAARGSPHAAGRPLDHDQHRRSAQPRRHRHRRRARPRRAAATASSTATACRWRCSRAISCASWRRSIRASPPTSRVR